MEKKLDAVIAADDTGLLAEQHDILEAEIAEGEGEAGKNELDED